MAVSPNTNDAFLREVDEELRRDELAAAWRRYGVALMAAIGVGLIAFGGWLYWQHASADKRGAQGEQLLSAYEKVGSGQVAGAKAPLDELAQAGSPGYRAMARFTQADLLLKNHDVKGASAKLGEIAADNAVPQALRDLALVRQTSAEYDTMKPQAVVDRLRPVAVKGNPYFASAGEMTAAAYLQLGRDDVARTLFSQIAADDLTPDSVRQRALQMSSALGASAAPQKKTS